MKTPEHKAEMDKRKARRVSEKPTRAIKTRGKYIPAGVNKNTKPENR